MAVQIHENLVRSTFTISLLCLATLAKLSISQEYEACSKAYSCGEIANIYYPFWGGSRPSYCGISQQFKLSCDANHNTSIQIGSQTFHVLNIDQPACNITMVRTGIAYDQCSSHLTNTSLETSMFRFSPNVRNVSIFYDCAGNNSETIHSFPCKDDPKKRAFYGDLGVAVAQNCKGVHVEVQAIEEVRANEDGIEGLNRALSAGFDVNYSSPFDIQRCIGCMSTKGICGSKDEFQFTCYCPDGTNHALDCSHHHSKLNWKKKVAIGVAAAVLSAVILGIAFSLYYRRWKKNFQDVSFIPSHSMSSFLEDTEKGHQKYSGLQFFAYRELQEATNNFDSDRELGDGGFGKVYFGKLGDGRFVAVKKMYENNYRTVEQFMNEVEILTGLRHQNLVSLYGCNSSHSSELMLVYEYVCNGTVADHLHGKKAKSGALCWDTRMNIAIDTASALVYLHASDIIHRDVKTNNILLDDHFRAKVADFGLSRLFPNHLTHISTAPQGTPGYVDPEYHEYYQLTDRSDVYSFGVVLIELISSMRAVDITRHRHEINLSNMAMKKIQSGALHEIVDKSLGFESDLRVRKMINGVAELAFRCLQSSKDMRPSMVQVLDTLKDIQSDGKYKSKPEVMDISKQEDNDATLLKNEPPPPSPDSNGKV
ncbi:LEAF RUST 10 DISEASE-RESISTANCE LOCUS RECEPTOR-LIKE PROTEIN KINASE-like 1.2 [Arachis stenosperma]|uniref:LEAF RUST 10 DISEASE-RESISTANCE LOCUS RECEPTOR-LIKE PROTEIN KINASE-like 1.2 n=1 Tax=Arachis stenosperma TaxID=217475 RepID=UPI0025ABAED4|nr:LEAF RUST 10 DISEASE-RESISTANCE LOCUS RECEPTOR-LIKE PROTEIN KINASE-like 1.2 [Arachis stenosperma]